MNEDEVDAALEEMKDEIADLKQDIIEKDARIDTLTDALNDIYVLARKVL